MSTSDLASVVLVPWPSLTVEAVLDLLCHNREHLAPWVPLWEPDYLTAETQGRLLVEAEQAERAGREAAFGVRLDPPTWWDASASPGSSAVPSRAPISATSSTATAVAVATRPQPSAR